MNKAYDRVEWSFLILMLRRMGFADSWVQKIMSYVESIYYSVVLNGQVGKSFYPSCGLRQGDPLNPYLFFICSEGLSALLRMATMSGNLLGVRVNRHAPLVTHLLFADDSLIFGEATREGAITIHDLLRTYAAISGQLISFDKSGSFFSQHVSNDRKEDVRQILGVRSSNNLKSYLGLPSMVGRNKRLAFKDLKEHLLKRVASWNARLLSIEGRELLIKVVLQVIPLYTMSCFLLPSSLCKDMEVIIAKFWWQKKSGQKGLHWCTWESLCKPKSEGGMGFQNLSKFNVALLAKLGWRLLENPTSLSARIIHAKYYHNTNFLVAPLGSNLSLIWRSIWSSRALLETRLKWRIGTGDSVSIWNDYWLSGIE